jgi:formylglycine-generating enzyme required for sulfatase activity
MENPIDLIRIPSGRFLMGSPADELGRCEKEGPQHEVELESFFMSRTPITQSQWREVARMPQIERELKEDPSSFKGGNRPVENVSWYDAMEFCSRLSHHTGRDYTLPSEAQWEYACRAGTTTPFHFGETISTDLANYDGNYTYGSGKKGEYRRRTTDVASFPANAWGLHDMHGNVWEWCLDNWHDSYEGAPEDGSAWLEGDGLGKSSGAARGSKTPSTAARPSAAGAARAATAASLVSASVATKRPIKLLRGGSWIIHPGYCRSACRFRSHPVVRDRFVGFRVCCLPQDQLLFPLEADQLLTLQLPMAIGSRPEAHHVGRGHI